eukprot:Phypoly_transcript_09867.p1 GENE.Phypoly_transcript_09867~~Phypoly_transcript_09867.p1  ORF type:complete len:328 (+),score=33.23 Phypoly_transcript_09867:280-1263(+)
MLMRNTEYPILISLEISLISPNNVTLILSGINYLAVGTINLHSETVMIDNTSNSFTTFKITQASFSGNLTIPGEIISVGSRADISFNGTIAFSGGIQLNSDSRSTISTIGSLNCGAPITLIGETGNSEYNANYFVVNNSILSAPSIKVSNFVVDLRAGSILVDNDFSNNGTIRISEPSTVIVLGNYTQHPNATLAFFNLNNTQGRQIDLVVNGTARYAYSKGDLKYNTLATDTTFNVTVITAGEIQGIFATNQFYDQDKYTVKKLKATLNYNEDSVQIIISHFSDRRKKDLDWWVFLLIGVGVVAVLLGIVLVVHVMRRRVQYQTVS